MIGKWEDVSENLFELFQEDALHTLCCFLKKFVAKKWNQDADKDVKITFVKFWYVIKGFIPTTEFLQKRKVHRS